MYCDEGKKTDGWDYMSKVAEMGKASTIRENEDRSYANTDSYLGSWGWGCCTLGFSEG